MHIIYYCVQPFANQVILVFGEDYGTTTATLIECILNVVNIALVVPNATNSAHSLSVHSVDIDVSVAALC